MAKVTRQTLLLVYLLIHVPPPEVEVKEFCGWLYHDYGQILRLAIARDRESDHLLVPIPDRMQQSTSVAYYTIGNTSTRKESGNGVLLLD